MVVFQSIGPRKKHVMKHFAPAFRIIGPFVLGATLGAVLAFTANTLVGDLESFVWFLAVIVVSVLLIFSALWLVYRWFVQRLYSDVGKTIKQLSDSIEQDPALLANGEFWKENVLPFAPTFVKTGAAWLGFTQALAISILLIGNMVLIATLSVQYLSAERLDEQNILLGLQTTLMEVQSATVLDTRVAVVDDELKEANKYHSVAQALVTSHDPYGIGVSTAGFRPTHIAFEEMCASAEPAPDCDKPIETFINLFSGIFDYVEASDGEVPRPTLSLINRVLWDLYLSSQRSKNFSSLGLEITPTGQGLRRGATYSLVGQVCTIDDAVLAKGIAAADLLARLESYVAATSTSAIRGDDYHLDNYRAVLGLLAKSGPMAKYPFEDYIISALTADLATHYRSSFLAAQSLRDSCFNRQQVLIETRNGLTRRMSE